VGFFAEFALWVYSVESSEALRLSLLACRTLCGWHVITPYVCITTARMHLTTEVINLLVVLFMTVHVISCAWALIANLEAEADIDNWVGNAGNSGSCEMYVASFYFSGGTLTTTGYGDILPSNEFEQVVSVALMMIGTCMIAQIRASLNWTITTHNFRRFEYMSKVSRIASALECLGISGILSARIFAYLEYTTLCNMEYGVSRHLDNFSRPLRAEFCLSRYHNLLERCCLFKFQSREVLHFLVHRLRDSVYLPSDFVFAEGNTPYGMFFVRTGVVLIEGNTRRSVASSDSSNLRLQTYTAGDYFGEVGVFTGMCRPVTARAACYCTLSTLAREVFEELQETSLPAFLELFRTVQAELKMDANVTWEQMSAVMIARFGDREVAFDAMLPRGQRGTSAMGMFEASIPMPHFVTSAVKLGVPPIDARLLWLSIDFPEGEDGTVMTLDTFLKYLPEVDKEDLHEIVTNFYMQFGPEGCLNEGTEEEGSETRSQSETGTHSASLSGGMSGVGRISISSNSKRMSIPGSLPNHDFMS